MKFENNHGLFKWCETRQDDAWEGTCPWCGTRTELLRGPEDDDINVHRYCECPLCGWYSSRYIWVSKRSGGLNGLYSRAILKIFESNPTIESLMNEVESYLVNTTSDNLLDNWNEVDQFVEKIANAQGYKIIYKLSSGDGDSEIVVISDNSSQALLKCSRSLKAKTIKIETVKAIEGATIDWDTKKSTLIMSTNFSKENKDYSKEEMQLSLVDLTELTKYLGIYNESLPEIVKIGDAVRDEIISKWQNTAGWHRQR